MVDYGPLKPQERRIAEINRALRRKKTSNKGQLRSKISLKESELVWLQDRSRVRQRFLFEVSLVRL